MYKEEGLPLTTIIIASIGLIIMVVLVATFTGKLHFNKNSNQNTSECYYLITTNESGVVGTKNPSVSMKSAKLISMCEDKSFGLYHVPIPTVWEDFRGINCNVSLTENKENNISQSINNSD